MGIQDALFTATQQRVLALLFGEPGRSFFANEVIRRAASGSGGVQRELARLVESGLVTSTRVGNQVHYRANPAAPIFRELVSIVAKTMAVEASPEPAARRGPVEIEDDWAVWER